MRRRSGEALVKNELRLLLAACEMYVDGSSRFYGYELARRVGVQDGTRSVMSQPTLYRCLRRLEERGALCSEWETIDQAAADGRDRQLRRYYRVTEKGVATARLGIRDLDVSWSDRHLRILEAGSSQ